MAGAGEQRAFGRYQTIRRIARGGMGELYLAEASGTGGWHKRVAIKSVLAHLSSDDDAISRFIDEARITMSLNHGNIVQVFDFDQAEDGAYYIVMEFVDGWDLRWLTKRSSESGQPIPEPLAVFIASQMARALSYAHGRTDEAGSNLGIVHRDITPSNVLISREGEVKLTDFGIAAARNRFERTLTGELRGKFGYMSPEQASGESLDQRSDLFAVGIVLFEMLTGRRPFDGATDMDTLSRVRNGDRQRLRELMPEVDEELERIVETALAFDPEERFQSASELQNALVSLLYQDTQPVTDLQLASFCKSLENGKTNSEEAGEHSSPGFDTLLRQQLDAATSPSSTPTGSAVSARSNGSARSRSLPARGPSSSPAHTRTIDARIENRRRRSRRRIQLLGVFLIVAVAVGALVLSYRAGQQGSILPTVLRVETKPPGARVFLDGAPYGLTTLIERVKPGVHVLQIYSEGHEPLQRTITCEANRLTRVAMHLTPLDESGDSQTFTTVQFFVEPGDGTVQVGDELVRDGETLVVPVGREMALTLEAEGFETIRTRHTFVSGEDRFVRRLDPIAEVEQASEDDVPTERPQQRRQRPIEVETERRVAIRGLPSGAVVSINGERVEAFERAEFPDDATASVRVEAPGYRTLEQVVSRDAWSDGSITFDLNRLERGWVTIRFVGDVLVGDIEIDGQQLGRNTEGPRARFELTEGSHDLLVRNAQTGHEYRQDVEVTRDANNIVTIDWTMPTSD